MKLQISTRLAIFAALELTAREGRHLSVAEIGEKYGVSSHHLAKVMHVMSRAGLVRSVRGAGGGYQFSGNARRVTLLDVAQLFEDLSSVEPDGEGVGMTPEEKTLRAVVNEIDDIARATLGSITIATMRKQIEHRTAQAGRSLTAAVSPLRGRPPSGSSPKTRGVRGFNGR